jgi:hypothetical protein
MNQSTTRRFRGLAHGALVAVLVTITALVDVSAVSAATAKVDPTGYVTAVCSAVSTLHDDMTAAGQPVLQATETYKAAPSQESAQQLRDSYVNLLRLSGTSMTNAESLTQAAGVPDVAVGSRFARTVLRIERMSAQKLATLADRATQIPITDSATFARRYSKALKDFEKTGTMMRNLAKHDPSFSHAPAVLRPLTVYFTTTADVCPPS